MSEILHNIHEMSDFSMSKKPLRKSQGKQKITPCCHKRKNTKKAIKITIVHHCLQNDWFRHLIMWIKRKKYCVKNTICELNFWSVLINIWEKIIWKKKHLEKPLLSLSLKNRAKSPYLHVVYKLQNAPVVMYPKNYTKSPY